MATSWARSFRGSRARKSLGLLLMVACKITAAKDDNGKLGEVTFGNGGGTMSVEMAASLQPYCV